MSVILVTDKAEVWRRVPLSNLFDQHQQATLETVLKAYDVVIPGDHVRQLTAIQRPDVRVVMCCTDLDSLVYWCERNADIDIVFAPSPLALLEAEDRTRQTLVLIQDVLQGEVLTDSCISTVSGGGGLGVECREMVSGLRALYPLKAGTPLDFGLMG